MCCTEGPKMATMRAQRLMFSTFLRSLAKILLTKTTMHAL